MLLGHIAWRGGGGRQGGPIGQAVIGVEEGVVLIHIPRSRHTGILLYKDEMIHHTGILLYKEGVILIHIPEARYTEWVVQNVDQFVEMKKTCRSMWDNG